MKELSLEQIESLSGGNFFDGYCSVLLLATTGAGAMVLAGISVATGGIGGWIWGGSAAACTVYGAYLITKD